MVRKVEQPRRLARSTLLVIIQILEANRPVANRSLAKATSVPSRTVAQIIKRLSRKGWVAHSMPGDLRRCGRRRVPIRYRLTIKGRQEAKHALTRQASRVGGKWLIHDSAPAARLTRDAPTIASNVSRSYGQPG